jgi:hypothetical protein
LVALASRDAEAADAHGVVIRVDLQEALEEGRLVRIEPFREWDVQGSLLTVWKAAPELVGRLAGLRRDGLGLRAVARGLDSELLADQGRRQVRRLSLINNYEPTRL